MEWLEDVKAPKGRIKPKKFCGQAKGYWSVEEALRRGYTPGKQKSAKQLELELARLKAVHAELLFRQGR